ncbi:MAG: GH105 [uncultured Corynebacteriales bacterium]|uniref:GH105 n=1 Tax=uncultured Mycobacteriales bacterium TaxID=581187 RepID=A0A6J4H7T8_9ACTN|nr:MAG: GH105 [uncultured Corynebacteriales bacterium]
MAASGPDPVRERVLAALLALQRQSWEQGVLGHALLDLGRHDLAAVLAVDAVARQTPAGKLAEIEDVGIVNSAANTEVVARAAARGGDPALAAAVRRQLDWLRHGAPRAADGTLFHLEGGRQVWVDTVYMVLPPLVAAGELDAAAGQLAGHRRRLYDPGAGLWAHRWDEDRGARVRAAYWASGNGWVVAGIARSLRLLGAPATPPAARFAADCAGHARAVIDAVLAHRAPSGLLPDVLGDPASFEEVAAVGMVAYAVLSGVADGWLPASYAGVGRSLVGTARRHVGPDGLLRPACGAPRFDRPGTSAEAQAFFLLATAAGDRLAGPGHV